MTDLAPAIVARQLSKTFGGTQVLHPLDLVIPRGSIFALVGHNGAGKTTLIQLLLNIIKPTGGSASMLGKPTSTLAGQSFRSIGYVSENQEMPEWMTVQDFMNYLRPFYPTWSEGSLLADLDLPRDRKLKHLSRGMRMKAALASVLAFHPPIILMDEPFSGLDPLVRDELIETLLDRLNDKEDSSTTILISSHDLGEIESFATHVAFLHQGKLLFAESMDTLTTRFREITVTFSGTAPSGQILKNLPTEWLLPEISGHVLRFIHTQAVQISPEEQVSRLFSDAIRVETEPMTLRTIFLALVKANRSDDRSRA